MALMRLLFLLLLLGSLGLEAQAQYAGGNGTGDAGATACFGATDGSTRTVLQISGLNLQSSPCVNNTGALSVNVNAGVAAFIDYDVVSGSAVRLFQNGLGQAIFQFGATTATIRATAYGYCGEVSTAQLSITPDECSAYNGGMADGSSRASFCVTALDGTVEAAPVSGSLEGPAGVCDGGVYVYRLTGSSGRIESYVWELPAGAALVEGENTSQVAVLIAGSGGTLAGYVRNGCQDGARLTRTLTRSNCLAFVGGEADGDALALACGLTLTGGAPVGGGLDTLAVSDSPCAGGTSTISLANGGIADYYQWAVPADAIILAGQGTNRILVQWGTQSGLMSVSGVGLCGGALGSRNISLGACRTYAGALGDGHGSESVCFGSLSGNFLPMITPTLQGSLSGCANNSIILAVNDVPGAIGYTWNVGGTATIVSGQGTRLVEIALGASGGNLTVTAQNYCTSSAAFNGTLTASACPMYAGGTADGASRNNFCSTGLNGSIASVPVTGTITGNPSACANISSSFRISILPVAGVIYEWSTSNHLPILTGQGTSAISIMAGTEPFELKVVARSQCFTGDTARLAITIGNCDIYAGGQGDGAMTDRFCGNGLNGAGASAPQITAISGSNNACADLATSFSTKLLSGAANNFEWSGTNGAVILAGQGTDEVSVYIPLGGTVISVMALSDCGNSDPQTLAVTSENCNIYTGGLADGGETDFFCGQGLNGLNAASPVTGTIAGQTQICSGQPQRYIASGNLNNTSFNRWEVSNGAIISGNGTDTVTVIFNSGSSTLAYRASNLCTQGSLATISVNIDNCNLYFGGRADGATRGSFCSVGLNGNVAPTANISAITGPATSCVQSTATFSVETTEGQAKFITWSVPADAILLTGQGGNQAVVLVGNSGGNVTAQAETECAISPLQTTSYTAGNCLAFRGGSNDGEAAALFDNYADYYATTTTGTWQNLGVWEVKRNGIYMPATQLPSTTSKEILVRANHNVTLQSNTDISGLIVERLGILNVPAGNTLGFTAPLPEAISISGTLNYGGSFSGINTFNAAVNNGGQVNVLGSAAVPNFQWKTGSTLQLADLTATPTNVNQTFANVRLQSPGWRAATPISGRMRVTGTLSLAGGILKTDSANLVVLAPGATVVGGSASSFIEGMLAIEKSGTAYTRLTFPIGRDTAYRPVALDVALESTGQTTFYADVVEADATKLPFTLPADISHASNRRYWRIKKGAGTAVDRAAVSVNYSTDDLVNDPTYLRILKSDSVTGQWVNLGGTGTSISGNFYSGSITSTLNFSRFSYFVLGNDVFGQNVLPVSLISFGAHWASAGVAALNWATATEKNSSHFVIQRRLNGSQEWAEVGQVKAAGNSQALHGYGFEDRVQLGEGGVVYYRLKQVDLDGTADFSQPVALHYGQQVQAITAWPNPASQFVYVNRQLETADVAVTDVAGRQYTLPVVRSVQGLSQLGTSTLPAGIYSLKLMAPTGPETIRLVKQ